MHECVFGVLALVAIATHDRWLRRDLAHWPVLALGRVGELDMPSAR